MSGLSANYTSANSGFRASLPGTVVVGKDGGYYTITASQPDDNTLRLEFTPSDEKMEAIAPVDITLPQGPAGKGDPGEDGISPEVTVSKDGKVTTITITDVNGTKTVNICDGTDGEPGDPGVYILSDGETIEDAPEDADVVIDPNGEGEEIPTVPTKVSELDNDSGYQTADNVIAIVQEQLGVIENGTY